MPEMPVVSCVCVEPPGWGGIRLSGSGLIVSSPVRLEAPRPRPSLEGDCGKRPGLPQWRPSRLFSAGPDGPLHREAKRSEEHTSELQSLMRISYAVFCLKKKKTKFTYKTINSTNLLH